MPAPENCEIIRTRRKTAAIEVTPDGRVLLRLPLRFPEKEIQPLLSRHAAWLEKALERQKRKNEAYPEPTKEEEAALLAMAKSVLPQKTEAFARLMGASYSGVKITSAKKRFGSCSSRNSICYSKYLMRYPENAIDYVVVHELAHTFHHDHGKAFYEKIASVLPDYKKREAILKGK